MFNTNINMPIRKMYVTTSIMCFFFPILLPGQYQITGKSIMELKNERVQIQTVASVFPPTLPAAGSKKLPKQLNQYFTLSADAAPKVYQYDELGMFCKFEVQIEKATRFPVKIRLGEVEAVDRKEGKWQWDNWND
jgi:hypothetical protein